MENARDLSSSPGLSTPPKSPSSPSSGEAIVVQPKAVLYPDLNKSPTQKSGTLKSTKPHGAGAGGEQSAPKQVRKRAPKTDKKKEGGDAAPKQRKPRAKKQKDHDPASLSATASKLSAAAAGQTSALKKIQSTVQPLISEALFSAPHIPSTHSGGKDGPTNPVPFPIGNKNEAIQKSVKSEPLAPTFVSPPPQIQMLSQSTSTSRGQNYDPIRSSTIEIPRPIQISNPVTSAQTSPVKTAGRASASPSIASLINPPATQNVPSASRPSSSSASASLRISPQQHAFVPQPHKSAASIDSPRSVPPIPTPTVKPPTPPAQASALPPTAMDIDSDAPAKPIKSNTSHKPSISTNNSSTAPSPKQPGTKSRNSGGTPTLPPLPGTGFLSGSSLFSNNSGNASNESGTSGQTIIIDVPLNSEGNKYINYARLVEEKYGRDALFPKQKAQRDRMARVAAVGAALENARKTNGVSADEMSLDVSDNEGEQSNADKKGSEADDGAPKKRKRTMKEDQYDKDDPFVDDTELAWEEQAAAVKDGFFVYRGPLVQPGDRPDIERVNGTKPPTTRGRGRGRGGGPGSRGGRGSRGGGAGRGRGAAAAAAAAGGATADTPDGTSETGHEVKRPRGGGTTRKPRITKADRARMEQEKLDRERAAQGLTANSNNPPPLAAAPSPLAPAGMQVVLPKSPAGAAGASGAASLEMVASR